MATDDQRDGFVSADEPSEDEIDLSAPEGTPEYERAQEEVMIRGAADAESDFEVDDDGESDGDAGDEADGNADRARDERRG